MDGAVEANPYVGLAVVAAAALNGIAVVRAYFLLFTGTRHVSTVSLGIGLRERFAVLTLAALILGGGLFPQPGVTSRERAAEADPPRAKVWPTRSLTGCPRRDRQSRKVDPISFRFDVDAPGRHRRPSPAPERGRTVGDRAIPMLQNNVVSRGRSGPRYMT